MVRISYHWLFFHYNIKKAIREFIVIILKTLICINVHTYFKSL